ncbi:t-SNARE [Tothia fuscella]|uniref:t-SNARE n=1 Tax=Tothia fuscella TaxID=1048955 RepID=A0A9P4P378_9PEZI|nr:t-SNARE [Tothia fuscella]
MARINIQDRTNEFHSILQHASRQNASKKLSQQRQSLLSSSEKDAANGNGKPQTARQRSEFAKQAATIGRGISSTMAKLERLAQLARRKTLFDDRPVEINELTYIIKQDLAQLDKDIRALQSLSASQHPQRSGNADQEGEHNKNVLFLLRGKLGDVTTHFKETLELRTKNIQASRSRTENFISSVASHSNPSTAQSDILSLEMPSSGSSALTRNAPASSQQLMLMEEGGSNTYIQQRGDAIETIERTMNELGGIFTQLAQMVSEQGEQIQRIDADTEDVLENVQGAQRELLKYWNRVSGNRWLVAKMFGVLMIFFLLWVLIAG